MLIKVTKDSFTEPLRNSGKSLLNDVSAHQAKISAALIVFSCDLSKLVPLDCNT